MDKSIDQLTDLQKEILNGHLLGDGSLSKIKGNGNSYFSIAHKQADIPILLKKKKKGIKSNLSPLVRNYNGKI